VIAAANLTAFQQSFPGAIVMTEGGVDFIYIPALNISTNKQATPTVVEALLCPREHSGYMTRLFLSQAFPGAGLSNNWTQHRILEKQWNTWSWQNVPQTDTPLQILAAHLRALQ
jgi:hypothetical protein